MAQKRHALFLLQNPHCATHFMTSACLLRGFTTRRPPRLPKRCLTALQVFWLGQSVCGTHNMPPTRTSLLLNHKGFSRQKHGKSEENEDGSKGDESFTDFQQQQQLQCHQRETPKQICSLLGHPVHKTMWE